MSKDNSVVDDIASIDSMIDSTSNSQAIKPPNGTIKIGDYFRALKDSVFLFKQYDEETSTLFGHSGLAPDHLLLRVVRIYPPVPISWANWHRSFIILLLEVDDPRYKLSILGLVREQLCIITNTILDNLRRSPLVFRGFTILNGYKALALPHELIPVSNLELLSLVE